MRKSLAALAAAAAIVAVAGGDASAQKSKDTIRLALFEAFPAIDPYSFQLDEATSFNRSIFQPLEAYDEHKGQFVPILAKAWRRVSPTVLEFDLRDDVKFHNGNGFDADDVVATVNYLSDPNTRLFGKNRYDWAHAEKMSQYKVRIIANQPFAIDTTTLAYRFGFFDAETMKGLDKVADYGRVAPVGTGPYKVASLDPTSGITVERYDGYHDDGGYFRAPVKRVQGILVPDPQTQVAKLLAGELDLLRNITVDAAEQFANTPNFKVTATPSGQLIYITLDASGRSDNKVFADERVRKALVMSLDRDLIVKTVVPGGSAAEIPLTICFKATIACKTSTQPYAYDPAAAKKLLAEAGYPNGVDIRLDVFSQIRQVGETIAGEIRKAGFRASIQSLIRSSMTKKRGDGELTAFVGNYPINAHPDTFNVLDFFFGGDRDYANDPVIKAAMEQGNAELDLNKRADIYMRALDTINTKAYILPVSELPILFAHSKDVDVLSNPLSTAEPRVGDYAWADAK